MALIKCSECGNEISDKAEVCIHCGNPIQHEKLKTMEKKKWNELSPDEKTRIASYRKKEKSWWAHPSRIIPIIIFIPGLILLFSKNTKYSVCGMILVIIAVLISLTGFIEQKNWYEKNVDELYEKGIIK